MSLKEKNRGPSIKKKTEINNEGRVPEIRILGLAAPIRHTLQALGALAAYPERCLDTATVARQFGLSATALSKSFQILSRRGVLKSQRGPGGGYQLAVRPETVTLASVAAALEVGGERRGRCLLEERTCRKEAPCLLHNEAVAADALMRSALERLTLVDLAADFRSRGG